MTISSVPLTSNQNPATVQNGFSQAFQDFKGIGTDIQSGDLTSAQSALNSFQHDLQNSSQTSQKNPLSQLFSGNSTLNKDLTTLQLALNSNDAAGAQSAFKALAKDMQSAMKTQRGHHHSHVKKASDSNGAQSSNSTTLSTTGVTASTKNTSVLDNTLDVQA
jgi:hypothetical protein